MSGLRRAASAAFAVLWIAAPAAPLVAAAGDTPPATDLYRLERAIAAAIEETEAPGAVAALVSAEETFWVAGFGVADRQTGRPVTPDTLFRLGSIAKSFVAVAVLRLVERGELDLEDRLRDLAPEVEFENPWEQETPVTLEHLLEHTAGFDDIHLAEYAHNDPTPITLRRGLAFHPASRVARWRPGAHTSYCNSGPAVAAYVLEKVTGRRFEDVVREEILEPLRMTAASYLPPPGDWGLLATGYGADGREPQPYWHILMRPSGALNAPVPELANLVRMLLARGSFEGRQLLTPASVVRMETPRTGDAARAGVGVGYALGSYAMRYEGFVFHGHGGGVNGGIADYGYLPGHGLGYVLALNSVQGEAFTRVRNLLRGYLLRDLEPPAPEPELPPPAGELAGLAGWYRPIAVRQEATRFLVRWAAWRVARAGDRLSARPLVGEPHELVPVGGGRFRVDDVPVAGVAFLGNGRLEGTIGPLRGGYRRVPAVLFWLEAAVLAVALALEASSILFALAWIPRRLFGRLQGVALAPRAWPLLPALCLGTSFALVAVGLDDFIWRFGRATVWSVSQWALLWLFAALSVVGFARALRRSPPAAGRWVRLHSLLVSVANLTVVAYLARWGILGFRSWA